MALVDDEATRERLSQLEQSLRTLDPSTAAWWARIPERNELRDAIDYGWRDQHRLGTRPEFDRRLPWPDDVAGRMNALRAYIEEYRGVRMSLPEGSCPRLEALESQLGPLGLALREWVRIVDRLATDPKDYGVVLRDAIGFKLVGESFFSVLLQGEDDYCWAVALSSIAEDDPKVFGMRRDGQGFSVDRSSPHHQYGGYFRLSEFIHGTLANHHGFIGPHERLARWDCPRDWQWRPWPLVWEPMELRRPEGVELAEFPSSQLERVRAFFRAQEFPNLDEDVGLVTQLGADDYAMVMILFEDEFGIVLEEGAAYCADYTLNQLVALLEKDERDE